MKLETPAQPDGPKQQSPLSSCRVLDLTDEKGFLCGKVLGDLGADVIKIERPGGDASRSHGPFFHDVPDRERCLSWFALNTSKRGITLNIDCATGQELFRRLSTTADIVIESFPPGYLGQRSLGYSDLEKINPGVIFVSITLFGQTGPRKDYKGSDLTSMAAGGLLNITGDPERPPVQMACEQSYCHAGSHAALGAVLALYRRSATGSGQLVDVSIQECVLRTQLTMPVMWEYEKFHERRSGGRIFRRTIHQREVWPCQDGFVVWRWYGGVHGAQEWRAIVDWMDSTGEAGVLREVQDWSALDVTKLPQQVADTWDGLIGSFFLKRRKAELQTESVRRKIKLCPVNTPEEVVENEHLASRGFWTSMLHPELDVEAKYPGSFFRSTEMECKPRFRAPLTGEHNEEVYSELGISGSQLQGLREAGVI